MIALIDADICVYRLGYTTENDTEDIAQLRSRIMLRDILDDIETEEFKCYLTSTDKSNFRFEIFPEYKANRKQSKPRHYQYLRNYFIKELGAEVVDGMEADDALSLNQTADTIICSIDKDLDQIPGWHYNFVHKRKYKISELEGLRSFYSQLLAGDSGDNITGCTGIGPKKATRILEGCQDEIEMLKAVVQTYQRAHLDWAERLPLAANLLWLRKVGREAWMQMDIDQVWKQELEIYSKSLALNSNTSPSDTNILYQKNQENILSTSNSTTD